MKKRRYGDRAATRMERPFSPSVEKSATVGVHVSRTDDGFRSRACIRRAGARKGSTLCGEGEGKTIPIASANALEQLGRNIKIRTAHRKWRAR